MRNRKYEKTRVPWRGILHRLKALERPKVRSRWNTLAAIATCVTAVFTGGLLYVAISIGRTQTKLMRIQQQVLSLQEKELSGRRVANVEVVGAAGAVTLTPDQGGNYWALANVTFRNTSKGKCDKQETLANSKGQSEDECNRAEKMTILYQFYDGYGWTGYFDTWKDNNGIDVGKYIQLDPKHEFRTSISSQTTITPEKALCENNKHFFIALRTDWKNPNGAMGCKVVYLRFSCPIGPIAGKGKPMVRPTPELPNEIIKESPSAVWPCPE